MYYLCNLPGRLRSTYTFTEAVTGILVPSSPSVSSSNVPKALSNTSIVSKPSPLLLSDDDDLGLPELGWTMVDDDVDVIGGGVNDDDDDDDDNGDTAAAAGRGRGGFQESSNRNFACTDDFTRFLSLFTSLLLLLLLRLWLVLSS